VQAVLEELALPACDVRDRGVRKAKAASRKKETDAFRTELPIEVRVIVAVVIERRIRRSSFVRPGEQDRLERLCPRSCVQRVAVGEDSVEVEDADLRSNRQAQPQRSDRAGGEPRRRTQVMDRGHRAEERRRLATLLHQVMSLPRHRGGRKDGTIGLECPRRRVEGGLPLRGRRVQIGRLRRRGVHVGCLNA
jgi:hypothetical protein